jgi:hypothetical protein
MGRIRESVVFTAGYPFFSRIVCAGIGKTVKALNVKISKSG